MFENYFVPGFNDHTHTHVDNKRPLQMSKSKQLTLTNSSELQGYMTF